MASLFVSYSHHNWALADNLRLNLERFNHDVWIDHENIRAGDDWSQSIDDGIVQADAVIVLISEKSMQSHYVTYEWTVALTVGKPIIPVKVRETASFDIHEKLSKIQFIDFPRKKGEWATLDETIDELLPDRKMTRPIGNFPMTDRIDDFEEKSDTSTASKRDDTTRVLPPKKLAYRVVIISGYQIGQQFVLKDRMICLGRDEYNPITLRSHTVSREHLYFIRGDETYAIVDNGSKNGTEVDGETIQNMKLLRHNMEIRVGDVRLRFEIIGDAR